MTDGLGHIRAHAVDIQEMISHPPESGKLYIYRKLALLPYDEEPAVACSVFVPSEGSPFAQAQRMFQGDEASTVKLSIGPYITATELALFLGLAWAESTGVAGWLRQEIDLPTQTAEGLGFPPAEQEPET